MNNKQQLWMKVHHYLEGKIPLGWWGLMFAILS
jgi:hypothetical protein